ncbi:MAG: hypothetical protein ACYS4W_07465 [Planctomycetota bacterium]
MNERGLVLMPSGPHQVILCCWGKELFADMARKVDVEFGGRGGRRAVRFRLSLRTKARPGCGRTRGPVRPR